MPRGQYTRRASSMDAVALRNLARVVDLIHQSRLSADDLEFLAGKCLSMADDKKPRQEVAKPLKVAL